jgi:membrane protein
MSKRSSFVGVMLFLILNPRITFYNINIDFSYLVLIFLIVSILIEKKAFMLYRKNSSYLKILLLNLIIFTISTLLYGFNLNNLTYTSLFGLLKYILLIVCVPAYYNEDININKKYIVLFRVAILVNLVGVILQQLYGYTISPFFKDLYLGQFGGYYSSLSVKSIYYRKFGFFPNPMMLGIFSLFSTIVMLQEYSKNNKTIDLLSLIFSFATGFMSMSKTFYLGYPIILLAYILRNGLKSIKKRNLFKNTLPIVAITPILFLVFIGIYDIAKQSSNNSIDYYLRILQDPVRSLETRYSIDSSDILLSETYSVIQEYPILGVGFNRPRNEFLGDSTYVLCLHNGGVVAFLMVISFYILILKNKWKQKDFYSVLFIILWIISGFALPTLFNYVFVIPFYFNFMLNEDRRTIYA